MVIDIDFVPWCRPLKITAYSLHGVAIASTLFRLAYRWYMARFWWEDGWATLALLADVACLIAAWLDNPVGNGKIPAVHLASAWLVLLGATVVLWSCRMSILLSIVRVTDPCPPSRRIAFFVGCSFAVMFIAMIVQKIVICAVHGRSGVLSSAVAQLITDVLSDCALVVLPFYFLRWARITRRQRTVVFLVFFPSLLITAVSIFHSIILLSRPTSGAIIIAHAKAALALIVSNILVIVAFISRMCHRNKHDLEEFTNVQLDLDLTAESTTTDKCTMTSTSTMDTMSSMTGELASSHAPEESFGDMRGVA